MRLTQILSLLVAAVAALIFYYFINSAQHRQDADKKTILKEAKQPIGFVLAANVKLEPGDLVTPVQLKWIEWPQNMIKPDYFVKGRDKLESLVDNLVLERISPSEPIRRSDLTNTKDRSALSLILPPNKKAFTVLGRSFANADTQILVGDRVDLIASKQGSGKSTAGIAMRAMKIIAIDEAIISAGHKPKPSVPLSVTFEVDDQQAAKLAELAQAGSIYLTHISAFNGINKNSNESAQEEPKTPANKTDDNEINIIRGDFAG